MGSNTRLSGPKPDAPVDSVNNRGLVAELDVTVICIVADRLNSALAAECEKQLAME